MLSYGCWCQIRNEEAGGIVPGRGQPVDELDAVCKAWHQCRACTTVDFNSNDFDSNESCNPNDVAYMVVFEPEEQRIDCNINLDQCPVSTNESSPI